MLTQFCLNFRRGLDLLSREATDRIVLAPSKTGLHLKKRIISFLRRPCTLGLVEKKNLQEVAKVLTLFKKRWNVLGVIQSLNINATLPY